MDSIAGFKEVAPYLTHPLVLVGFILFLFFGIHRTLLRAKIIPPLEPSEGSKVVQLLLRYGFWIAFAAMSLGFALTFFKTQLEHDPAFQQGETDKARLEGLRASAEGFCQRPEKFLSFEEPERTGAMRACIKAVADLPKQPGVPEARKEDALVRLAKNDTQGAKNIYQDILTRKAAEGKGANQEAAEAARNLGALAFYDNTQEALAAYRRAVELDPENMEGWNQLGSLLLRVGQLNDAEAAFGKVKAIAETGNDRGWLAATYVNLGNVDQTRGDLGQAEAMYKKALAIYEALGLKEGMAGAYGNLGVVYHTRGDLGQAEAMYKKALDINEALGRKEGMASAYGHLGNVYQTRGDLGQAEAMHKKALDINEALGRKEGMADAYGDLGVVYQTRGDLGQAEAMYKKALDINEAFGRKWGMANAYGNLGIVYQARGDLGQAEAMYKKALALFDEVGASAQAQKLRQWLERPVSLSE